MAAGDAQEEEEDLAEPAKGEESEKPDAAKGEEKKGDEEAPGVSYFHFLSIDAVNVCC